MHSVEAKDLNSREVYYYMIGGIGPRPIALVSTISADGEHNLAPFSFFNGFGANPPMIGFSPARRGRDGTLKDTYNNLMATKECVVQVVTHEIVEQVNVSSTEYEPGIDEFVKSGLTALDSDLVKAKRVKESPFHMECKLHQMIHLGDKGGAGNLAICEILKFHVAKDVLDEQGRIDQRLIDLVGRNGGNYYTRSHGDALFEIPKPLKMIGMGFDNLPESIKNSEIFTGNNLARFASLDKAPAKAEVEAYLKQISGIDIKENSHEAFERYHEQAKYQEMLASLLSQKDSMDKAKLVEYIHLSAKVAIEENDIESAWKTALTLEYSLV